ncbi:MAG: esterase-like activity of phytase family protein [Oceanicaulis sp.]
MARLTASLRMICTAAIAGLIAACGAAEPADIAVSAEPVALFPDDPGRTRLGALRFAGGLVLDGDHDSFGGWSALELSPDGARLLALSDRGAWMTARLDVRAGAPAGLSDVRIAPVLGAEGGPLVGERADAEGLAGLGAGRFAVGFEREHRIAVFELGEDWAGVETASETAFPGPPGADRLRANAGIEALAATPDHLYAAVEDPIVSGQPHTLWVYDRAALDAPPRALQVAVEPGFGLTALTAGPQGAIYMVQRYWSRDVGNRIRIARLSAEALAGAGGAPLRPEILAELEPDMTVDNIEAAAFAQVGGAPMLFVISDDNFNPAQRTLLLAFRVEG